MASNIKLEVIENLAKSFEPIFFSSKMICSSEATLLTAKSH